MQSLLPKDTLSRTYLTCMHIMDWMISLKCLKNLLSYDEIEVFFKLYILLYADDTVIFAEAKVELQSALNAMYL